jgi:uracil-DNA glycosylase
MMNRDDANMMTREDVLRELELLPVWQLRTPLKVAEPIAEKAQIVEVAIEAATEKTSLELIISDDTRWIFAYPATRMDIGSQGILFNNILLALKIEKTNKILLENVSEAKVIIAMGETTAQQLLKTTESIEQLRGKTHTYQNIPLIVTFHPQELLQYLPNKAKTWDDLCIALQLLDA